MSCNSCGAILSIDFDGNVSLSEPGEAAVTEESEPAPEVEVFVSPVETPAVDFQSVQPADFENAEPASFESQEPVPDFSMSSGFEPAGESFGVEEAVTPAVEEPAMAEESSTPPAEFHDNWIDGTDDKPQVQEPPATVDFSDVVEYANAAELDNSPLVYAFRIEGIDHKETRKKVLDVLSDIRLNIHLKDVIPTIKGGILELHDLSPIRASLIASRLREEAVTFRWRQSVFQSQVDLASGDSQM